MTSIKTIALQPDDAANYRWRGQVYYALERYEEALADFNRAVEMNPEDSYNVHWRGTLYHGLGALSRSAWLT
jgi:regulator of sirC expression with transglutaminase-like and TPR domain